MYQPSKYKNNDIQFIFNFIRNYPFATIVLQGPQLLATHVPVLIDGDMMNYRLYAHIANHNPMWNQLKNGKEMLMIFKSPDAYISSSWYTEPDIPTWDYAAVHINARIQLQDEAELLQSLENLIAHFEKDQENPLNIDSIPKQEWDDNFKHITGFWLEPLQVAGIEKFHQGFGKNDIENITNHLNKQNKCPMQQVSSLIKKEHDL